MPNYGEEELRYALPIASALEFDAGFRAWFVGKTKFAPHATIAHLNYKEQLARRTRNTKNWWRSYWTTKSSCHCGNCRERETDLMAVFSLPNGYRFALHVEVKGPHDRFSVDQARDYGSRANCWAGRDRAPKRILPHDAASTVLVCDSVFRLANKEHVDLFDSVITFDEISALISPYPDP